MYDKELVIEIISQILIAIGRIEYRFEPVVTSDYFLDSELGLEKLDSICMAIIAIGESLKNLDKVTSKTLLVQYPSINWKRVKGMRDIISHHYFDLDSEIVFEVCKNEIQPLKEILKIIKNNVKNR